MKISELPRRFGMSCVRVYQWTLSPFIGNRCRFHPTCSQYAVEALEAHGLLKGGVMAARRLGRCHPFHPGGFDPVPTRKES